MTTETTTVIERAVARAKELAAEQERQGRQRPMVRIRQAMRAAAVVPAMAAERCAQLGQQLIGEPMTRDQVREVEATLAQLED